VDEIYTFTIGRVVDGKIVTLIDENFDFAIFEIINNNDIYYVIPRKALLDNNKLDIQSITIKSPKHKGKHWSKKYLNAFDLLK
jgi:hypothetical protein